MPRKKSAAKKAKEAESRAKQEHVKQEPVKDETSQEEEEEPQSESSSEEEDEYGELITEGVASGIDNVLTALRNNDTAQLLNPEVKFFEDPGRTTEKEAAEGRHKPIFLKDYHRMNILSGKVLEDEDEGETVDGKQSYVSQQNEEKSQLLKEINDAFDGDEENSSGNEGDDLLVKKERQRAVPELKLPDPEKNSEAFLKAFDEKQAWIPRNGDKLNGAEEVNDEDDDEFENAVENFENAYNFRFEDPDSADIVSYARNQATLRRSDNCSRRRKREETKKNRQSEVEATEKSIHKKKTEKVQKLTDVLGQLQKEYGKELDSKLVEKITNTLFNSDFKDDQWDKVVGELFDAEFYAGEGKPSWDEDDEIMADIYKEAEEAPDNEAREESESESKSAAATVSATEEHPTKKAKKNKQKDKKSKRQLHEAVENAVEQNKLALIDEVEEERKPRACTREEQDMKFRYREVSPESFGLTARDIFAADDVQLNKYIGLKKFAPYRPKELRMKDKRKASKPKRLREWRKETFRNEDGPVVVTESQQEEGQGNSHKKRKTHKLKSKKQ